MNCLIWNRRRYLTRLRLGSGPGLSGGRREDHHLKAHGLADELVVTAGHGHAAVRGLAGRRAVVAVDGGDGGGLGDRVGLHPGGGGVLGLGGVGPLVGGEGVLVDVQGGPDHW